jgi:hypothetical protein
MVRSILLCVCVSLALLACTRAPRPPRVHDAGIACRDHDGDGFGAHCARGPDCDDDDPALSRQCRECARPNEGCACPDNQVPIPCYGADDVLADGRVMCHQGTRRCLDGVWGACENMQSYPAPGGAQVASLVDPTAPPENCSKCDITCFTIKDLLLADAGVPGTNVSYGTSGGLTLGRGDGGGGVGAGDGGVATDAGAAAGDAGGATSGCAGLALCCATLSLQPAAASDCATTVAGADDMACDAALTLYCPSTISGATPGCTVGASSIDSDCDGIPDAFDECTAATVATNPACGGRTNPLATSTDQTIFHVIAKGSSAANSLEINYKVQNADVYFLMDMSDTMGDERDDLVNELTSGDVVECALLKNCCDHLTGAMQTSCLTVVKADKQANCQSAEATYCKNPAYLDCSDGDFDGVPDNAQKTQGVIGAIRCLVGSSWFGAGYFRELPFRDGVTYIGFGGDDTRGIQDRGNSDEHAFRHWVDMTSDATPVYDALRSFTTDPNYDYPEGDIVALYSLATGKGQVFGHNSVNIAQRAGAGCAANTFGYPCFRKTSIPVVVLFTDDPLSNGPATYSPGFGETDAIYDSSYKLNGKAPSSGNVLFTPIQAETFATAQELGDVSKKFVIAAGETRDMKADYPYGLVGCFAASAASDAVFRFELSAMDTVKFAMNVAQDPLGYSDSFTPPNLPTPATDFPVVLSLFRGDPTAGGALLWCQRVCPAIAPYNTCKPLGDLCSTSSSCCSSRCSSGRCSGTDPAGTKACYTSEVTNNGWSASLAQDTYYLTVKGRRAGEAGFYELQVGDPAKGSPATKYTPPVWSEARDALTQNGIKVVPVISCDKGSNNGRCDGAASQLAALAAATGVVDKTTGKGLVTYIKPDGTGLGSGLAMAVRDLANYLTMDISLSDLGNPGFLVDIQKCTNPADPAQARCTRFSIGCWDTSPIPRNTVTTCQPGATPVFVVNFTNPDPSVPPNPADPYGGYHFKLQLVGDHQHLLEEIPVYLIPTDSMGPPPMPGGAGTYATTGSYAQELYGAGCGYYQNEGEAPGNGTCLDQLDNDGDLATDADDDGCKPGSCMDGVDNDGDGLTDLLDPQCMGTQGQLWSDLYFRAQIPAGTSIDFYLCTADDPSQFGTCSYSRIATVTSTPVSCSDNAKCMTMVGDSFCGDDGFCQVISPPKASGVCASDADCPNSTVNGHLLASRCNTPTQKCVFSTPPADIASNLAPGDNGKPYAKLRVDLHADSDASHSPTLYEWSLEYSCPSTL